MPTRVGSFYRDFLGKGRGRWKSGVGWKMLVPLGRGAPAEAVESPDFPPALDPRPRGCLAWLWAQYIARQGEGTVLARTGGPSIDFKRRPIGRATSSTVGARCWGLFASGRTIQPDFMRHSTYSTNPHTSRPVHPTLTSPHRQLGRCARILYRTVLGNGGCLGGQTRDVRGWTSRRRRSLAAPPLNWVTSPTSCVDELSVMPDHATPPGPKPETESAQAAAPTTKYVEEGNR